MARCCDHSSEHYPDPGDYSLVGEIDMNYIILYKLYNYSMILLYYFY